MLHTKSQGHRPSSSGEEDFWRGFTIYGHGGHLGHVIRTIWTNFHSPILRSLHMKYEFNWPRSFSGEDVWKFWRTADDGRQGHWYTISSPMSLGSGELKIHDFSMIIQDFSNSMIFHAWNFFSDFPGFPWFPELVGTLIIWLDSFHPDWYIGWHSPEYILTCMVNVQTFWTLFACQTIQTQIRLLPKQQSDQGHFPVCYSDKLFQWFCSLPILHLLHTIFSLGSKAFISASPTMQWFCRLIMKNSDLDS